MMHTNKQGPAVHAQISCKAGKITNIILSLPAKEAFCWSTLALDDAPIPSVVDEWMEAYCLKKNWKDPLPLDFGKVTLFTMGVLGNLARVPFGTWLSYNALAAKAGAPRAARAVGTVCNHNTLQLVVPCHRVLRTDGGLAGYAPGLEIKKRLLAHEGIDP